MTNIVKPKADDLYTELVDNARNQEQNYATEKLLLEERERQIAISQHAADLAMIYGKLSVVNHTGSRREYDETVHYRTTPWIESSEHSTKDRSVSFAIKNEGYEEDTGPFSILKIRVKTPEGDAEEDSFATIGDYNASTGVDEFGQIEHKLRGVTIVGGDEIKASRTPSLAETKAPELVRFGTDEFKSVQEILDWMSKEYKNQESS